MPSALGRRAYRSPFFGGQLGAWYAGTKVRTALTEVAHYLRREAAFLLRRLAGVLG